MENSDLPALPYVKPLKRRGNPNWVKGKTTNPGGIPAPVGFQDPAQRAKVLLDKYTPEQIVKFASNIAKAPVSSGDAIIIVHLANILSKADGLERERLYDRTFGKVPDRQINLNVNIDMDPDNLSNKALDILAKLSD